MDLKQKLKTIQKLEQAFIRLSASCRYELSKNTLYYCEDCQCSIFNFIRNTHKKPYTNLEIDAECYICLRGYTFVFYGNPDPFDIVDTLII